MRALKLRVLAVSALVAVSLSACAAPGGSAAGHLVVYSGQHPQTSAALVAAFERQSGISVSVRSADEAVLANQLLLEGSRSPADVFVAENSPALETVAAHGLLSPLSASTLTAVPAADSSPTGRWVGVTARVATLAYNTGELKASALPRSIMELASPRWRGKLGLAPSESDFQPVVASVAIRYGNAAALAWLEGLKANAGSRIYSSNEELLAAINRGAVSIGVVDQYYWYRMAAQVGARSMGSALATFNDGDAGYVESISGAAVLASSHQQVAARRFVAFLVSPEGQAIIAHSGSFEYPLAHGAATPPGEPAYSTLHPVDLSVATLGTGSISLALLREAQLL